MRDGFVTSHVTSDLYPGSHAYVRGAEWSGVYVVTHDGSMTSQVISAPYPWSRAYASGVELTRGVELSGVDPSHMTAP
jgi:hypothetical protein